METVVEIHVLQNFAPSNLNRDDTGAPKVAFFGGTRRARVSSQCFKRALRQRFNEKKKAHLFQDGELGIRTKRILGELVMQLKRHGRDETEAREKIIVAINSMGFAFKENDKTEYLVFLGEGEIKSLARLLHEKWDEIGEPSVRLSSLKRSISEKLYAGEPDVGKLQAIFRTLEIGSDGDKISDEKITAIESNFDDIIDVLQEIIEKVEPISLNETDKGKTKKRKKSEMKDWEKRVDEVLKNGKKGLSALGIALSKVLDGGKAVDVALFGRMLADMPEKNQNAACQVAHAISTNAVEREFDFYTAVDDLKPEDTAGADMMGTVEFNSACFYRYAVVDWEKLLVNLQNDTELAIKGLRAFLEGFVMAEPTGKQNTFAAHNPPEFVAVSVRRDAAPRSLANAFETAVRVKKDESLTKKSAEALARKAATLESAFGGIGKTYVLNPAQAEVKGFGTPVLTLQGLLDKAIDAVKE